MTAPVNLPSFASGSSLELYIDNRRIAFATSITFSDNMTYGAVGGIGSFMYDNLEPLSYIVQGSFQITHYDQRLYQAFGAAAMPNRAADVDPSFLNTNFFSPLHMLVASAFDIKIWERNSTAVGSGQATAAQNAKIAALTAAIATAGASGTDEVKAAATAAAQAALDGYKAAIVGLPVVNGKLADPTFEIQGARLNSYSLTFTPGQVVTEQLGFIALRNLDREARNTAFPQP